MYISKKIIAYEVATSPSRGTLGTILFQILRLKNLILNTIFILNSMLIRQFYILFLFTISISCSKKNDLKKYNILKYKNLNISSFYDNDSILKIICYDENKTFIDTIETNRNAQPNFLIKDLNNDNLKDLLIINDFSGSVTRFVYNGYFSDKNFNLQKPIIIQKNKKTFFFSNNNDNLISTNLTYMNDEYLISMSNYNSFTLYKINNINIVPVILIRKYDNVEDFFVWSKDNSNWVKSNNSKDYTKKIELIKNSNCKNYIGE